MQECACLKETANPREIASARGRACVAVAAVQGKITHDGGVGAEVRQRLQEDVNVALSGTHRGLHAITHGGYTRIPRSFQGKVTAEEDMPKSTATDAAGHALVEARRSRAPSPFPAPNV